MSHIINADSIKQAVFEELQNILSTETNIRQTAEVRMKQLEVTEAYGIYLSELIMNQSIELPMRQMACSMLTRYVENNWHNDALITDPTKKIIRNILPNGLYDPNSKIRSAVAHAISTIASTEWPDVWPDLFPLIIECLGGNDDSIHGAIQILQEFTYDEVQVKELGPVIISEVHRIFDSNQTYSIKTRASAIKLLKSLFTSIISNIPSTPQQVSLIEPVLNNFLGKMLPCLNVNAGDTSSFLLRTEILKLFTFLASEKHIQQHLPKILPFIWQLVTNVADLYVKVIVNQTQPNPFPPSEDEDDDELGLCNAMVTQTFEFIQCIVTSTKLRTTLKNVLTDLIYIIILYIQLPEEQIELWNDDPDSFMEADEDTGVELSVRVSAHELLVSLCEEMNIKILPHLAEALTRHMDVAEAEKQTGNQYWWKIQEASMVAVHICKMQILEAGDLFDLPNYLTMVRTFLNYGNSPHLVARALTTLSSYSTSSLFNNEMLEEILSETLKCLAADKPTVLKISAVRAIFSFVSSHADEKCDKHMCVLSKLPGFVEGIMDMIGGSKTSLLGFLLEALSTILSFDDGFAASISSKIIPLVIAVFLRYPEDPYIQNFIQGIIKALSENPLCVGPLQEKFIPILTNILSLEGEQANPTRQNIALDALNTIAKYSTTPLSSNFIDTAFSSMIHCVLNTDDYTVMLSGGECLQTLIYGAPEQVCAYKNGEGLNYVMQVTTMLLNPTQNELTAVQVGRLMITIIMKVGHLLGENIGLLLKAVISKMQLVDGIKGSMSLVIVFAHLFVTQMEAALNFLTTIPGPTGKTALEFVLSNWLPKQMFFYGTFERKITMMALCKLFEYGVTTQDARLSSIVLKDSVFPSDSDKVKTRSQVAEQSVDRPCLVMIFKLLLCELAFLKEAKLETCYEEHTSDEEDDDTDNKTHHKTNHRATDLYDIREDEDDDGEEDDQVTQEIMREPAFQADMEENLIKFLQDFSTNEYFPQYVRDLNDAEKCLLQSIQIEVA